MIFKITNMKRLIISCIGILLAINGMTQSCLLQGITFKTQSQVDSFSINYPNCRKIEGNVMIGDYLSDISNLNGLSNLDTIGGHCSISNTNILIDLTGLSSLKSIGGCFFIQYNEALTSFDGLDSLNYIGGYLDIYEDNRIINLSGFESVKTIKDYVWIRSNDSLTSLSGIDNIAADSLNAFWAVDNPMLSSCAIKSVCDYLNKTFHHADFYNNSTGCNSETEVDSACAGLFVDNLTGGGEFSIYPNPASKIVSVETHSIFNECKLSISNLNGQELIHFNINDRKTLIDIGKIPSGIYFIRILHQAGVANLKLIKN
jgi:hypothetical protein